MNTRSLTSIATSLISFFIFITLCGHSQTNDVLRLDPRVSQSDFVPGVILFKIKDAVPTIVGKTNGVSTLGVSGIDAIIQKYQVKTVQKLFPESKALTQPKRFKTYSGTTIEQPSLHNIYKLEISEPNRIFEAIDELKKDINIEYAEPNYILSIVDDQPASEILTEEDVRKMQKTTSVTPNDPLYSQQTYIQTVRADAVWDSTKGDSSQIIAILDTGVDWLHPDLKNKIWINQSEANGVPGIDDDGNGLIDDIRGWDYINNDNNPTDDNSHGTHVAGIAAAEANNGIGIAGVNWYAKILPIKVFQSSGRGDLATIAQGIIYAANKHATVINMSFGSYSRSMTMEAALANAYTTSILVAASGNDGIPIGPPPPSIAKPFYPAAYSFVLGVQAGDALGSGGFSNYDQDGPVFSRYADLLNYELKSPGSRIISSVPNGNYRIYSGTSMAAPIISGAVALYKSMKPDDSKEILWGNLINSTSTFLDIQSAVNANPKPILQVVSNTIVDTLFGDNNNGLVNAGETIELWCMVRNTWGQADSVFVQIRFDEFEDTSTAQILIPTAFIGSISSYAKRSNEISPLKIHISPTVANNRDIVFNVYTWCAGRTDTSKSRVVITIINGIELSGFQAGLMTLSKNKSYLVTSNFAVDSLIIEPGTIIKLFPNTSLFVLKYLLAEGTINDRIIFSGDQSGYWNHIKVFNGSPIAKYCIFEGSKGYAYDGSSLATGFSAFEDCIFRNNIGSLFWYSGSIFRRCIFTENSPYQMLLRIVGPTFQDNLVIRNHMAYIAATVFASDLLVRARGNSFFGNIPYDIGVVDIPWGAYSLGANYYGTFQKTNISAHILDFFDDGYYPILVLDSALLRPSLSAHGHTWKILVNGVDPLDEHLDPIGEGIQRFDVYFNRAMDTSYTPQLSFGVREPFTQQSVVDSSRWSPDQMIWTSFKTVKLHTGDGINRIRVTSARDLENFEIPIEDRRFEFVIDAAGSASTEFTATAGLGKINLEWNKNDLSDLLGFNMYRFTNITDTTYSDTTLINTSLLTDTLFSDYNVLPGKNYYYTYKVVRTDFSESEYSKTVGTKALTSSPGDCNGDLAVNVLDVVSTVSYILGQNPQPFIVAAADINNDTTINVLDIVGTIYIILHPGPFPKNQKRADGIARLDLSGHKITLTSDVSVSAVQFRLEGKGLKEIQFVPDASIGKFEVASSSIGDSIKIVIIYSINGTILAQGNTTLGTLPLLPSDVKLTEGIVANTQGKNILTNIYDNGKSLIPEEYYLSQNYPNPFNMSTKIQFGLPERAKGRITIFNVLGQRVRSVDLGERAAGRYEITWDGMNETGRFVSSGVYFYRIEANKFNQTKKLLLIK